MSITLNFLTGAQPLTKTYRRIGDTIEAEPYPNIKSFTSHAVSISGAADLAAELRRFAERGGCLLKGTLERPLVAESRAGQTNPSKPTKLFVHDLDGHNATGPQEYLDSVGLGEVDYVVQYSAGHGISGEGIRCHIFQLLSEPTNPAILKSFSILLNLDVPALRAALELASTGCALRYVLDVTANQNDKLIYIAPPVFGPGVEPGFEDERIVHVKRGSPAILPAQLRQLDGNELRKRVHAAVNALRRKAGLPDRKFLYRRDGAIRYLAKPGEAQVTGIRRARGFVYLNLNGGDSWAYYHPEDNPEYIFNFKGEPVYRTSEIVPDYYAAEIERLKSKAGDTSVK